MPVSFLSTIFYHHTAPEKTAPAGEAKWFNQTPGGFICIINKPIAELFI